MGELVINYVLTEMGYYGFTYALSVISLIEKCIKCSFSLCILFTYPFK